MPCHRFSAPNVDLFVCGSSRSECHACKSTARASCQFGECGKPLCDTHMRKVGNESRCAQHAPMTINKSMPKPPARRLDAEEDGQP
jgi:hypothetical protein